MNDSSAHATMFEVIERSICPAGWTLPRTGESEDSFQALWEQYGWAGSRFSDITNLTGSPLYFVASGFYHSIMYDVGYDGLFWSPVVQNSYNAVDGNFGVFGFAGTSGFDVRSNGYSVRCIARPVTSEVFIGD